MIGFRHMAIATATTLAAAAAPALAGAGVGPTPGHAPFPYPSVKYCQQLSVAGAHRWSFRGGHFNLRNGQAWALAHGTLNERNQTASGYLCQHVLPRGVPGRDMVMKAVGHYVLHDYAPRPDGDLSGDVLRLTFKVVEDAYGTHCELGAVAHVTLYGSNNGDRSNSVQINFPQTGKGQYPYPVGPPVCTAQDRSYLTGDATVHIPALSAAPAVTGARTFVDADDPLEQLDPTHPQVFPLRTENASARVAGPMSAQRDDPRQPPPIGPNPAGGRGRPRPPAKCLRGDALVRCRKR